MGFIIHFYIIFGTNLLTQSPVPDLFFPCFRVSQKRKIKRSPIDLKLHETYFWTRRIPRSIREGPGESRAAHEGRGRAPCLGDSPEVHRRTSSSHIYPYTLKTSGSTIDREFRRQKPPQPPKTNLDPFWHPAGGGDPSPVAIFIIPVLSMTRREQFTLGAEGMYQQLCV